MATAVEIPREDAASSRSKSGWGREFDLLLACCAGSRDAIAAILESRLDWARFIGFVEHHRLTPQVYAALSSYGELIPLKTFQALQSTYGEHVPRCLWFASELTRICRHLQAAGITAIPHKGPVLAQMLYTDIVARQFSDLDILVAPADVVAARTALAEIGYKPGLDLSPSHEQAYIESGYERTFDGEAGPNLLELQWRILPRFYSIDLDVPDLIERAVEIRFGDESVRTLSAGDLFIVLCVHAAKHGWMQLSWVCDIAEVVKSRNIDWDIVSNRVSQLKVERIVAVNLLLAERLLGVSLPENLEQQVRRDPQATAATNEAISIIVQSAPYDTESMAYFRLMLRLRERRRDRIRFLWRLATTPSVGEWSVVSLPKALFPLYHAVRAARLAKRLLV